AWSCDPDVVVGVLGDLARDEGAVADRVRDRAADEAAVRHDAVSQLRMVQLDAGVDHRDSHGEDLLRRVERVERVVATEVPLPRDVGVVRLRRGSGGGAGHGEAEQRDEQNALHAGTTVSTGESPTAKPLPATTRAR